MNNDWFLLCIGGALSAFANFLISSHFEVFTILGVLVTLVIGAFACFMRQHVPEAVSYTHPPSPRDKRQSRMPSSA